MSEIDFDSNGQWALVTSVVDIQAQLPYTIADGLTIERPSADLRDQFKRHLTTEMGSSAASLISYLEFDWKPGSTPATMVPSPLPEERWRYYVLSTNDGGQSAMHLHRASALTSTPLDFVSLSIFKGGRGQSIRPGALLWRSFGSVIEPCVVTKNDLEDLSAVYREHLATFGSDLNSLNQPQLTRAHDLLDSLAIQPAFSDFHVLGLFAIVEMLVTHNPKLEDRGDSISHQICTKLPLLFNRFASPIDMTSYFGQVAPKKVWAQLYGYRSAIAHGGTADFSSGSLQVLGSRDNALNFLRAVVKRLIRHAYAEPQLLRDLCEI